MSNGAHNRLLVIFRDESGVGESDIVELNLNFNMTLDEALVQVRKILPKLVLLHMLALTSRQSM